MIADVLPRLWERNPDEARRRLEMLRRLTRGAMAEMRTLLVELRPSALLDADLSKLLRQLDQATSGRAELEVDFEIGSEIESASAPPPDVNVTFDRGDPNCTFRNPHPRVPPHLRSRSSRRRYVGGSQGRMAARHISIVRLSTTVKPNVKVALYRITQEALNNVVKHPIS